MAVQPASVFRGWPMRDLQQAAHDTAVKKGWHEGTRAERDFPVWCMMSVTEVSEAVEARLLGLDADQQAEEIADAIIRTLDTAAAMHVDLERATHKAVGAHARRHRAGSLPRTIGGLREALAASPVAPDPSGGTYLGALMMAVTCLGQAVQAHRKSEGPHAIESALGGAVAWLLRASLHLDADLDAVLARKMVVNLDRPLRHGNKPY